MAACLPRPPSVCKQLPGQPVDKQLPEDSALGDRVNMAFAGTLVSRGRGRGVVTDTALDTELGHVASAVLGKPLTKAPLLVRMERFTNRVAILVGVAALLMAAIAMARGMPLDEIFLLAVALAAQLIHIGAMYTPWINEVLDIQPITPQHWMELLCMALTVLVAMELHKTIRRRLAH